MKKLIFSGVILFLNMLAAAQQFDKNVYFEADMEMVSGNYERAQTLFEKLLRSDPENANLNFLNGYCLINLPGRKKEALPYLEKAAPKASNDYKYGSYKEENAPLEVLKHYATALRANGDMAGAIEMLNKYKSMLPPREKKEITLADEMLQSCHMAQQLMAEPVYFREYTLGDNLRQDEAMLHPVVSNDETMLFYSVEGRFRDEIFYSEKEGGLWTEPRKISTNLGVKTACYPSSISADNTRLYLTVQASSSTDIWVAEHRNGKWSKMMKLNKPVNTKDMDSQAWESADGEYLYFASDRKGGEGEMDLYRSGKDKKGNWDDPVNLGNTINTAHNEIMPVVSVDGTRLFFKSDGHENLGGYDAFVSASTGNNEWGYPVNLGYPLNTPDDDINLLPLDKGYYAYKVIEDPLVPGNYDIARLEIFSDEHPRTFTVSGKLNLQDEVSYGSANIQVFSTDTYNPVASAQPDALTGNYSLILPGGSYMINFENPDFKTYTYLIDIPEDSPADNFTVDATLEKEQVVADIPETEKNIPETAEATESGMDNVTESYSPDESTDTETYQELGYNEVTPSDYPVSEKVEETTTYDTETFTDRSTEKESPEPAGYTSKQYAGTKGPFTVQFMALPVREEMSLLDDQYRVEIQQGPDNYYRYVTGVFSTLSEAEAVRRNLAEKHKKAFVRFYDLEDYLDPAKTISDDRYTVQIMALKEKPADTGLSRVPALKITKGGDGWYRCTSGEYTTIAEAKHALQELVGMGFSKAYIRKTSSIPAY